MGKAKIDETGDERSESHRGDEDRPTGLADNQKGDGEDQRDAREDQY